MQRRTFLKIGFLTGLASILGGIWLITFEAAIRKMVSSIHTDLIVPERVVDDFLVEAESQHLWERLQIGAKEKLIIRLYSYFPPQDWLPYSSYFHKLTDRVIREFLPATNFFYNQMDTSQPLQYLGLYNPFKRACGNPFSSIYYQESTLQVSK